MSTSTSTIHDISCVLCGGLIGRVSDPASVQAIASATGDDKSLPCKAGSKAGRIWHRACGSPAWGRPDYEARVTGNAAALTRSAVGWQAGTGPVWGAAPAPAPVAPAPAPVAPPPVQARPVAAPPVQAPPVQARPAPVAPPPPVAAPPVAAPPVAAPPVAAPPVAAPPVQAPVILTVDRATYTALLRAMALAPDDALAMAIDRAPIPLAPAGAVGPALVLAVLG